MTDELKRCPTCNGNIGNRTISFYTGLIKALYEVCKWCQENNTTEFEMNQVRHLLPKNEYARFGDFVWFDGIVSKKGKAQYAIDVPKARSYFKGEIKAPLYVVLSQLTHEIVDQKFGYISEIKKLSEWLNEKNKLYMSHSNPYDK